MGKEVVLYENMYKKRFSFGKNWKSFLKKVDKKRLDLAKESLIKFTKLKSFKNKSFIDIGCGSGLFSLSACLLNAKKVVSIDVDDESINCAKFLRSKFKISSTKWIIKKGSILDLNFIKKMGVFDLVYSWGVLHHTGNMGTALKNITYLNKKNSLLYLAIYNEFKGFPSSKTWYKIKKIYSKAPNFARFFLNYLFFLEIILSRLFRLKKRKDYKDSRGMDQFHDIIDWLGGFPYEFASVEKIVNFFEKRNFYLINIKKNKGWGCNEFLFKKD